MHYFMYVCLYSSDTDLVGYSLVQTMYASQENYGRKRTDAFLFST